MVEVNLWSGLRRFTDGAVSVQVEARNVGEMLAAVAARHPGLADLLEDSVSVAIDGRLIEDSMDEPIPDGAEVWLMRRLKGG